MVANDALLTLAQFSLALAGFTGVAIAFSWQGGAWHPADAFRTWRALASSLSAAFLALIPIALQLLGIDGDAVWRWSSAVFLAHSVGWTLIDAPRHWRNRAALKGVVPRSGAVVMYSIAAALTIAQALNASGALFRPQPGVYFCSLLVFLLLPAFIFARIPFVRPKA